MSCDWQCGLSGDCIQSSTVKPTSRVPKRFSRPYSSTVPLSIRRLTFLRTWLRGIRQTLQTVVSVEAESLCLVPQSTDSKLDSKSNLHIINELAELNNCNVSRGLRGRAYIAIPLLTFAVPPRAFCTSIQNTLYFEARKHQDLYLWASKTPNGPSAKLFIQNIHTMDELKMTGNCLKGSRPILSFDSAFDQSPHWSLLKELLTQAFGVPRTSRRTKPFVDHVLTFSVLDGKIWFRNYQIIEEDPGSAALQKAQELASGAEPDKRAKRGNSSSSKKAGEGEKPPTLVEIGPRFVMTPIRIFEGSFGGATLYENPGE